MRQYHAASAVLEEQDTVARQYHLDLETLDAAAGPVSSEADLVATGVASVLGVTGAVKGSVAASVGLATVLGVSALLKTGVLASTGLGAALLVGAARGTGVLNAQGLGDLLASGEDANAPVNLTIMARVFTEF